MARNPWCIATVVFAAMAATASSQVTERVSVDSSGAQADAGSVFQSISADGRYVAFTSYASNLVGGDTNGTSDIFVHDRATGLTERVSVDSSGAEGNDYSDWPSISSDGRLVAFESAASNLVAGDTNGCVDVFVHDRQTGITERVSVDSSGEEGGWESSGPVISADGQIVAFFSFASNLVANDTNGYSDVFVHNRSTGSTERVSVDSAGAEGDDSSGGSDGSFGLATSADGRFVAFASSASNLVAGDSNGTWDIFVRDRSTGLTERVSVDSSGVQANADSGLQDGASISADGRIVAFSSYATNLVAGDTNATSDVFIHDRSTGLTDRVSVDSSGAQGNEGGWQTTISADGLIVAFESGSSNLVPNDTNGYGDVFTHDRSTGFTMRVSVDSSGAQANDDFSERPAISADGRFVAFDSWASNLVVSDSNGTWDVFVHDRCPAIWSNYGAGFPGTNGVPSFASQAEPVLGTTATLDLSNSYGNNTIALLFVGFQRTTIHSSWGGDLLVVPVLALVVGLPANGTSFSGAIPNDDGLCGLTIDLQAIESDPGAGKGVSFTPGLELVLGH
jgi:hypothetical protein